MVLLKNLIKFNEIALLRNGDSYDCSVNGTSKGVVDATHIIRREEVRLVFSRPCSNPLKKL